MQLAKQRELDVRRAQAVRPFLLQVLRAEGVEHQQHAHAGPRTLLQDRRERVRDRTRLRVVHLHRDRVLRRAQVAPELRIQTIAVQRQLRRVAAREMKARVELDRSREQRIGDGRRPFVIADRHDGLHRRAARDGEDTDQGEHDDEEDAQHHADALDSQHFSHLPAPFHILHAKMPSPVLRASSMRDSDGTDGGSHGILGSQRGAHRRRARRSGRRGRRPRVRRAWRARIPRRSTGE